VRFSERCSESGQLLYLRPCRFARIHAEQRRFAVEGGGEDHAVGFDAHQLRWLEVRHDYDLASYQLLRGVLRGDARDDGALFVAGEDGQLHQLR
jgi:hypothetical protein